MIISIIPLALAFVLSVTHFMSDRFSKKIEKYHYHLVSLSAGIFITYIIIQLLPEIFVGSALFGEYILIVLLGGFVFFHLIEKYTYQHAKTEKHLIDELAHLHIFGFFLDSFVVGFTLVLFLELTSEFGAVAIIPFFPFLLHTLASSVSLQNIHNRFLKKTFGRAFLASATFMGALVAYSIPFAQEQFYMVFAFLVGVLFYIVTRNTIPSGKKGVPALFAAGVILTLLSLSLSNSVV